MMGRLQQQLPAMFALAHERQDGARVQLAGMLADVFLADEVSLSPREEQLVNELIDQLMQMRNPGVRAKLVEKFADKARMPRKIAVNLVCEPIDVAGDILRNNLALTDEDLITVVHSQSPDHARAVAARKSIGEAVADALVVTGDVAIMQIVAENLGAKLSQKAIDILTDAARFAAELREPVFHRPEMTAEAATKLFWWISQDLRRYALKRFGISSGQIDEALGKTIDDLLGHHELDKFNDGTMAEVADWLAEHQAVSVKILPQVLRLGHFRLFNILLSRLANLTVPLIDTIVAETGGRGLAVVCRAIGIDKSGFVSIFLLSRGARPDEQIVHPRELSYALAAFDRLSIGLAQDLLHSWKQNPSYLAHRRDEITLEDSL